MSVIVYDVIQRFEVENGVPRLVSTNIQVIEGGDDLMSVALYRLEKLGFCEKFDEVYTDQYIGYKRKEKDSDKGGHNRYQLVLSRRKDGLCISIPKSLVFDCFSSFPDLTIKQDKLFPYADQVFVTSKQTAIDVINLIVDVITRKSVQIEDRKSIEDLQRMIGTDKPA